jgi:hypothetical protein
MCLSYVVHLYFTIANSYNLWFSVTFFKILHVLLLYAWKNIHGTFVPNSRLPPPQLIVMRFTTCFERGYILGTYGFSRPEQSKFRIIEINIHKNINQYSWFLFVCLPHSKNSLIQWSYEVSRESEHIKRNNNEHFDRKPILRVQMTYMLKSCIFFTRTYFLWMYLG